MPAPRRIERLAQLIHEVAAQALQRHVADPRIGFVTITRVKLGRDLADATIYWSSLGTEAQKRTTTRALTDVTGMIQNMVAKALQTRTTPKLLFRYDPSMVHAGHMETLFEKIRRERPDEPVPPAAEAAAEPAEPPEATEPDDGDESDPS